ncbi:MAG: hypothetical protein A4E57_04369 [Syntrophorhabdaceae bacterium PtaU1.Bin034]|nr:MAG: hypothetical protein A4E57_04369 [Syntrophorhabdaceae bacterium PtaU1.Bin034]
MGVDVVVKPRGALPDKACVMGHFGTAGQILFDPAHGGICCLDTRTLTHPEIDNKLVAFGRREELVRHEFEKNRTETDASNSHRHSQPLSFHEEDDRLPVDALKTVEEVKLFLLVGGFVVVEPLLDKKSAKERREHAGDNKGDGKRNGHGERERNDELTGSTREDEERQK